MNFESSKEYDAFGPWIFEINEEHPLPPLFRDYSHLAESAAIMFKVPRHIERRSANPNMHLYDAVIGMFDTHLLLLSRSGNFVDERRVHYSEIQAVTTYQCLLLGELFLYTERNVVKIKYNTVSEKIITKAVALIRDLQNNKSISKRLLRPMRYDFDTIEYLYVNLLNVIKENDSSAELVAYQPTITLPKKEGFINGIARLFTGQPRLQCTAFVTNGRDIIIISRTTSIKSRHDVDFAYSYTFLPITRISKVSIRSVDKQPSLSKLTLMTKSHNFEVMIDERNSTGISELYDYLR